MEIAKFIFSAIGVFLALAGFFGGMWRSYTKKLDEQMKAIEKSGADGREKLNLSIKESMDRFTKHHQNHTQKQIDDLKDEVKDIRKVMS
ncbi:MAG: hypothetical protein ACRC5H_03845, partial [Treponemataceae bacterium]